MAIASNCYYPAFLCGVALEGKFGTQFMINVGDGKMEPLKTHLANTCNTMYKTALAHCKADFVDEDSCFWYHSIWQYLRLLDCVSSPDWHTDFYTASIKEFIKENDSSRVDILISGCADNSMLYVIVAALSEIMAERADLTGKIVAVDLCDTPLIICRNWWNDEKEKSYGKDDNYSRIFQEVEFITVEKNIFTYSGHSFDLIITDAFLTRFQKDSAISLLQHWKGLLKDSGQVITTVRLHTESPISLNERYIQISGFVKKVLDKYTQYSGHIGLSLSQIKYKANVYAVKMTSHSLGDADEVEDMVKQCFKIVNKDIWITPGELSTTHYGHYVLRKEP